MRYYSTQELKPGQILAKTLFGTDGRILIKANTPLTPFLIQKLTILGFAGTYVLDEGETEMALKMAIKESTRLRAVTHLKNLDLDKCIYAANEILQELLNSKDITREVNRISCYDTVTWIHSVDVCTYSCLCGIAMGYDDKSLKELSEAALLHDIGKSLVNTGILNKPARLTEDEFAMMKNHPVYGFQLLKANTTLPIPVITATFEHHENEDGSGYPRGIKGDKIHRYAKIIHATDVYEACTAKRPYKKPMNPADAMENLMGGYGSLYDMKVIDILRSVIVLYPVGSAVLLSDGRLAYVKENRRFAMQRPTVRTEDGETIDLLDTLNLTIMKIL